jgi:DedD protein
MANQPGNNTPRATSEEIQLRGRARRRLVGAIALVAIIVTVLPMVMVQEPKPAGQDIAINIPSVPARPGSDSAAAAGSAEPAQAAAAQKAGSGTQAESAPEKPVEPAPAKAEPPASPQPVKGTGVAKAEVPSGKEAPAKASAGAAGKAREDKAQKPSEPDKGGFAVQLGAFSSAANAKQLQAKLTANGIHSYTQALKTDSGTKIRVRAGPYASRAEAEKVRDKLKTIGEKNAAVVADK